jgi:thiamine-phosphate pyrophosphorylase
MLLIVNDHLDIALACNADGIHLGQSDLPVEVVRNLAPDLLIGISTHNLNEVKAIMNSDVDYHNIGPIFKTNTKNCQSDYLGIEAIQQLKFDFPFSVMGGIKRHHFPDLVAAGVCRIAMVSEITQAENICKHVQILRSELIKLLAEKNIT